MRKNMVVAAAVLMSCLVGLFLVAHLSFGMRLMMNGAKKGNSHLIRALLAFGYDVNGRDGQGGTSLMYAVANGRTEVVRSLLAAGADVNAVDNKGNTALCYALDVPLPNTPVVQLLMERGALKEQSKRGNPLMCIEHSATSEVYIDLLVQQGVDVNAADSHRYTPLMKFAYEDNPQAVVKLVQHGAHVNEVAADGQTALSEAVSQGSAHVVEFLLNAGADPTVRVDGRPLLELASAQRGAYQKVNNPTMPGKYSRIIELLRNAHRHRRTDRNQSHKKGEN